MRITLPRALRRLWIFLNTAPIDVISPEFHDVPRETQLLRGLSAIQAGSRDNVIEFQRRRELTACCESSPFRKSVN
jgi:hypothetical protein